MNSGHFVQIRQMLAAQDAQMLRQQEYERYYRYQQERTWLQQAEYIRGLQWKKVPAVDPDFAMDIGL